MVTPMYIWKVAWKPVGWWSATWVILSQIQWFTWSVSKILLNNHDDFIFSNEFLTFCFWLHLIEPKIFCRFPVELCIHWDRWCRWKILKLIKNLSIKKIKSNCFLFYRGREGGIAASIDEQESNGNSKVESKSDNNQALLDSWARLLTTET